MITSSFIQLPGIDAGTERSIWSSGIGNWAQFRSAARLPSPIAGRRPELLARLGECEDRLAAGDAGYFVRCMDSSESWRLYADFRDRAAFVDIETTGPSPSRSEVTVAGVLDRDGYRAFVAGENLADLPEALSGYSLVVTFNGTLFDLPFLERAFGRPLVSHAAHIDLIYPLRKLGYKGGLKVIEQRLGLDRDELHGISGRDAVRMWSLWLAGDRESRDVLVRYNAEDVKSLVPLAELAYRGLADQLEVDVEDLKAWEVPLAGNLSNQLFGQDLGT